MGGDTAGYGTGHVAWHRTWARHRTGDGHGAVAENCAKVGHGALMDLK